MKQRLKIFFIFLMLAEAIGCHAQTFEWAKQIGGTDDQRAFSIAVDNSGNVFTTGNFMGTADFDPSDQSYNMTSLGFDDVYVSKFDINGNFMWAKKWGGTIGDSGQAIDVDESGNVYITGYFENLVDFDPSNDVFNLSALGGDASDVFISKLDSSGSLIWVRQISGTGEQRGYSLKYSQGNIYLTGQFDGAVDFDPGADVFDLTSSGGKDIFVVKLDSEGSFVWATNFGGAQKDEGNSIAVDALGNVFTTGYFKGIADFDPGDGNTNLTAVDRDIFISKLDENGSFVWVKQIGGIGFDWGLAISVDMAGNSYATGSFSDTVDFDPGIGEFNLTSLGYDDMYLVKLDPFGNLLWARQFGGEYSDAGESVILDDFGSVYTSGYFYGVVDFDPSSTTYNLSAVDDVDIFISKLDSSGTFLWAKQVGGLLNDVGNSLALDPGGNIYATGMFDDVVDFDPSFEETFELSCLGISDIFILKLGQCYFSSDVEQVDNGLTAVATNASYQWLDCNEDFAAIPNETGQTFLPATNGSYAVQLTQNECIDTSFCYTVNIIDVNEYQLSKDCRAYPNPANCEFTIEASNTYINSPYTISDVTGRPLLIGTLNDSFTTIDITYLASGFYLVHLGQSDKQTISLLKE